jgi:AcrR family transcriptional regulator
VTNLASTNASTATESRKAAQGAATRASLLVAARKLFGTRGFAATSMDDLAAEVGMTKGALYHHFAGKEAAFRAVYEQVKREVIEQVAPTFVDNEPWEALVAGCMAILDAHLDPMVRRIVLLDGPSVLGGEVIHEIESRYGAIVLRGALRQAMHAGVIERQPLVPLARLLNGALTEACALISEDPEPQESREVVGAIVERLLRGLRPES